MMRKLVVVAVLVGLTLTPVYARAQAYTQEQIIERRELLLQIISLIQRVLDLQVKLQAQSDAILQGQKEQIGGGTGLQVQQPPVNVSVVVSTTAPSVPSSLPGVRCYAGRWRDYPNDAIHSFNSGGSIVFHTIEDAANDPRFLVHLPGCESTTVDPAFSDWGKGTII